MDLLHDGQLDNKKCKKNLQIHIYMKNYIKNFFFFFITKIILIIIVQQSLKKNGRLAIAVCAKIKINAHSTEKIDFSLVWNMPNVCFFENRVTYKRLE